VGGLSVVVHLHVAAHHFIPTTNHYHPKTFFPFGCATRYRCVVLENQHLRVEILPDLGGKVQSMVEKATGKEALFAESAPNINRLPVALPQIMSQCLLRNQLGAVAVGGFVSAATSMLTAQAAAINRD
jgi:hypothetical protein